MFRSKSLLRCTKSLINTQNYRRRSGSCGNEKQMHLGKAQENNKEIQYKQETNLNLFENNEVLTGCNYCQKLSECFLTSMQKSSKSVKKFKQASQSCTTLSDPALTNMTDKTNLRPIVSEQNVYFFRKGKYFFTNGVWNNGNYSTVRRVYIKRINSETTNTSNISSGEKESKNYHSQQKSSSQGNGDYLENNIQCRSTQYCTQRKFDQNSQEYDICADDSQKNTKISTCSIRSTTNLISKLNSLHDVLQRAGNVLKSSVMKGIELMKDKVLPGTNENINRSMHSIGTRENRYKPARRDKSEPLANRILLKNTSKQGNKDEKYIKLQNKFTRSEYNIKYKKSPSSIHDKTTVYNNNKFSNQRCNDLRSIRSASSILYSKIKQNTFDKCNLLIRNSVPVTCLQNRQLTAKIESDKQDFSSDHTDNTFLERKKTFYLKIKDKNPSQIKDSNNDAENQKSDYKEDYVKNENVLIKNMGGLCEEKSALSIYNYKNNHYFSEMESKNSKKANNQSSIMQTCKLQNNAGSIYSRKKSIIANSQPESKPLILKTSNNNNAHKNRQHLKNTETSNDPQKLIFFTQNSINVNTKTDNLFKLNKQKIKNSSFINNSLSRHKSNTDDNVEVLFSRDKKLGDNTKMEFKENQEKCVGSEENELHSKDDEKRYPILKSEVNVLPMQVNMINEKSGKQEQKTKKNVLGSPWLRKNNNEYNKTNVSSEEVPIKTEFKQVGTLTKHMNRFNSTAPRIRNTEIPWIRKRSDSELIQIKCEPLTTTKMKYFKNAPIKEFSYMNNIVGEVNNAVPWIQTNYVENKSSKVDQSDRTEMAIGYLQKRSVKECPCGHKEHEDLSNTVAWIQTNPDNSYKFHDNIKTETLQKVRKSRKYKLTKELNNSSPWIRGENKHYDLSPGTGNLTSNIKNKNDYYSTIDLQNKSDVYIENRSFSNDKIKYKPRLKKLVSMQSSNRNDEMKIEPELILDSSKDPTDEKLKLASLRTIKKESNNITEAKRSNTKPPETLKSGYTRSNKLETCLYLDDLKSLTDDKIYQNNIEKNPNINNDYILSNKLAETFNIEHSIKSILEEKESIRSKAGTQEENADATTNKKDIKVLFESTNTLEKLSDVIKINDSIADIIHIKNKAYLNKNPVDEVIKSEITSIRKENECSASEKKEGGGTALVESSNEPSQKMLNLDKDSDLNQENVTEYYSNKVSYPPYGVEQSLKNSRYTEFPVSTSENDELMKDKHETKLIQLLTKYAENNYSLTSSIINVGINTSKLQENQDEFIQENTKSNQSKKPLSNEVEFMREQISNANTDIDNDHEDEFTVHKRYYNGPGKEPTVMIEAKDTKQNKSQIKMNKLKSLSEEHNIKDELFNPAHELGCSIINTKLKEDLKKPATDVRNRNMDKGACTTSAPQNKIKKDNVEDTSHRKRIHEILEYEQNVLGLSFPINKGKSYNKETAKFNENQFKKGTEFHKFSDSFETPIKIHQECASTSPIEFINTVKKDCQELRSTADGRLINDNYSINVVDTEINTTKDSENTGNMEGEIKSKQNLNKSISMKPPTVTKQPKNTSNLMSSITIKDSFYTKETISDKSSDLNKENKNRKLSSISDFNKTIKIESVAISMKKEDKKQKRKHSSDILKETMKKQTFDSETESKISTKDRQAINTVRVNQIPDSTKRKPDLRFSQDKVTSSESSEHVIKVENKNNKIILIKRPKEVIHITKIIDLNKKENKCRNKSGNKKENNETKANNPSYCNVQKEIKHQALNNQHSIMIHDLVVPIENITIKNTNEPPSVGQQNQLMDVIYNPLSIPRIGQALQETNEVEPFQEPKYSSLDITFNEFQRIPSRLYANNDVYDFISKSFKEDINENTFPLIDREKPVLSYPTESTVMDSGKGTPLKKTLKYIPSVSQVLNSTLPETSKTALKEWRSEKVDKLGVDGFQSFYTDQIQKDAEFHACIKKHILGSSIDELETCHPTVKKSMASLSGIFPLLSNVSILENPVLHSKLPYHGIVDCVARYDGKPVLIEWKQADKRKTFIDQTYDAPVQLSAYLGALNSNKNYKFQIDSGLIIVAYTNGHPADVFTMSTEDCRQYWKLWLSRLRSYILPKDNAEITG